MRVKKLVGVICTMLLAALGCVGLTVRSAQAQVTKDDWTTSLHDVSRDGASADTTISTSQAPYLTKLWSFTTGGPIASQPAIVDGVAYVGSWDGYEYALNASTGALIWKTFLGTTTGESDCDPQEAGVSSAATLLNGVVYVGGGGDYWYALNASTGAVLWDVYTGDSSASGGHYNWSSPLIVNGYAYVGVASLGDCPLVQGQLIQVNISTGQVVNTLNLVPDGSIGGGIWTSPAYDPNRNEIFAVTGTETSDAETYAQAVVGINASTMTVEDYWHLPESEAVADSDWTTSTGLYTAADGTPMLVTTNKNGYTYAFNRTDLAAGPVWQHVIAIGNDCAACGYSTVSSAAIADGLVFQAGGVTTINGVGYGGSVQALNENTGAVVWQHPEAGPVIGAVTWVNGMVVAGAGSAVEVLNASNGQRLYSYDTGGNSWIYAAPSVAAGTIITGNTAGVINAFALPAILPSAPPPDPNCPSSYTCQDIGSPTPAGSENVSAGTWTVAAGGSGIGGTNDQLRFMSQPSAGDVQITAQVTAESGGSGSHPQAGIMLRQTSDPGSPYYGIFVTPGGLSVEYRNTPDTASKVANIIPLGGLPVYLQIQRKGDVLQASTSTDGVNFTTVPGSTATVVMPYASLAGLVASSGDNGTSATDTFDDVSIGGITDTPQSSPPASSCPTGWNCGDIGDPLVVGNQSLSGSSWTFQGAGNGIGDSGLTDQFHYVYSTTVGDTTLSTHITALPSGTAGLMIRADTGAGAAYYGAFLDTNGLEVMYRDVDGTPTQTLATVSDSAPAYLEITRSGDTFSAYTSADGATWTPVVGGSETIANLSGTVLDGEAVTSDTAGAAVTATADLLSATNGAPAPANACPANWTCTDVGVDPIPPGSNYLVNGVWSILGGGKDIWADDDEFHLTAETVPGNGTLSAEVSSQQDTDPWAKSGLMFRTSTDVAAPYYAIVATPGNGTVVQYRTTEGGSTTQLTGVTTGAPIYIEVVRSGDTFTAYTSSDGVNWTEYPDSQVTISALSGSLLAGMADTSHSQFGTSTAVFDDFTFTPGAPSLPPPWSDADVGSPTPAGSASYANGVFTLNGGGNDIWGTNDQFNYVSQSLTGDGSIVARVTSQSDTDPWAKSGVMIKQSTTGGSAYALLAVTPGNGVAFQYGFNSDVSGGSYTFPNAWLELTRSGNTVTAYSSPDGNTWTEVGTTTVSLTDPVTMGLFVCSHNSGELNTSTFDNVSVTDTGSGPTDTVTFNAEGGAAVASMSGPDGSSITLPADTYPGYSFDGWFTAASGGTEVGGAGASYTIPVGGTTLYAQWTENAIDTVAFNAEGGAAVASMSGPDGSSITLPADTYPGYSFDGWFTAASGGTEVGGAGTSYTIPVGGTTLYAQWTENAIDTVAFNAEGGAAVPSMRGPDGSSITLPADTYPGYSFDGWLTAASGGTEVGGAGASYTIPVGGTTLYAQWIASTPTVSAVRPNSGPLAGGTAITITGTGFVAGAKVVIGQGNGTTGAIAATSVKVVSPTQITAVTGGGAKAGSWTLFVTTSAGTSAANTGADFSYGVTVTKVSPNTGPTSGGTAITITGTGFVAGATVVIGQGNGTTGAIAATSVKVVSPTQITAVTGGGAKAGSWTLFVTTSAGTSAANTGADFSYGVTVTKVSPNTGPTSGGTAITITGTGFVAGATVVIGQGNGTTGAIAATSVKVVSPTQITAVTGGGAKAGSWTLFVTTSGGTGTGYDDFTYH